MQSLRGRAAVCALGIGLLVVAGSCSSNPSPGVAAAINSSRQMPDGKWWTTENLNLAVAESYCYAGAELNCRRYGRLYSWQSARQACRALGGRWRLPSNDEWRQLAKFYGGIRAESVDTGKAAYQALLIGGGSGFDALLGGGRAPDSDEYARLDAHGFYWTASETGPGTSWFYNFGKGQLSLGHHDDGEKQRAFSVRCVSDTAAVKSARVLSDFEGTYDYRDNATVILVATSSALVAVIGEAKYPLRAVAGDTFANGSGDRILFMRGANGSVSAFQERLDTFNRRSATIPATTRELFDARPPQADGRPATYSYLPPPALADGIRVGVAGTGSLPRAVAEQIVNGIINGTYPDIRAIAVHHKGSLVLEEYFYGYDRDRPHQMRSLTKSVISLLAGAAVDRELLRADEPVLARLGYTSITNPDPRKAHITLTHLLSNQSGLACNDYDSASPGNEVKLYETADWPRALLDLPMIADPGTVGRYCSFGFKATGRMIERAAGRPLAEFAQEVLFQPLGISRDDWRWTFVLDSTQRNEFGQIYLRPRDMLKLGLLIQQRGEWQGRRVISDAWIDAAVAKQSRVGDSDYGLGIWHRWYGVRTTNGTRRVETIMLSGNGGQKVYLVPSLDLIVVFTGGSFNMGSASNELMARVLLPALIE